MNITVEKNNVVFAEIENGKTFLFAGMYYMKTFKAIGEISREAVNLSTGRITPFGNNTLVYPRESELIVKGEQD